MRLLLAVILALGGLGLASATALAGGGHCRNAETSASQGEGQAVVIGGCGFRPVALFVAPGTTVTWTNADPMPHNVIGVGWGDATGFTAPKVVTQTFTEPGLYPYECTVHPGMAGVVVVGGESARRAAPAMASAAVGGDAQRPETIWLLAAMVAGAGAGALIAKRFAA